MMKNLKQALEEAVLPGADVSDIEGEIDFLAAGADYEDDESFWTAVALGYLLAQAEQKK